MSLATDLASGLRMLERAAPETFIWNALEIPCVSTTFQLGHQIVVGGIEFDVRMGLFVRLESLPDEVRADMDTMTADTNITTSDNETGRPKPGRFLTFRDRKFRILQVTHVHGGYRLDLIDPHRTR